MNQENFHTLEVCEVLKLFKTSSKNGLSTREAASRLKLYGYNRLKEEKSTPLLLHFFHQFADFMIMILIFAALVSFFISYLQGHTNYIDPLIIFAIIILNAVIGTMQETKAEKSLEALKKLASPTAKVIRDGILKNISSDLVVPGDLVLLESGDFVPADIRLIHTFQFKMDESSLTGESKSVSKAADFVLKPETPLAERKNLCFSSSVVTLGHGTGVVVKTGMDTEVGTIAHLISTEKTPQTPLQKKLASLGKTLGILALFICGLIFVLGIGQGRPVLTMFMTSVSLAVASIPEGLPIVVTIMLSLGVQNMARKNTIVRRLPAVETLGSATIICSDKTGTLTQNKMTVVTLVSASGKEAFKENMVSPTPFLSYLLKRVCLCCNSRIQYEDGKKEVFGDPTENALVLAADHIGINKAKLDLSYKRLNELPFDSLRKRMSVVFKEKDSYLQVTKGAFDFLLPQCTHFYQNGESHPLTHQQRELFKSYNQQLTSQALRVIAVAEKTLSDPYNLKESSLTLLGLIGMIDPPRPEVYSAIKLCKQAGIRPIMITGDHITTAISIGKELGILTQEEEAISGSDLDLLTECEFQKAAVGYQVYARVSPSHKLRIVKALQNQGHIVAMTGDGINDAPALNAADIGCAMGLSGTDVAKNAADMILTDDNFVTIVTAIEEGRGIYDNIKKSIHFLLSSNIGELLTIFTAILFRLPTPLLAIHLLWINLITDSLPAIALGVEVPDKDIMKRKPISPKSSIFSEGLGIKIILEGMLIGFLALSAFLLGYHYLSNKNISLGQTMCFSVLSLSQLFHSFNMRSNRSLGEIGIFTNKRLTESFFICFLLQTSVITFAPLRMVFHVSPLNFIHWSIVILLSICPILVVELQKKSYNKRNNHKAGDRYP
ncbi:MAG: calcium-translocating P-type ATPase, PMCA-type [Acetivibrio sp.]